MKTCQRFGLRFSNNFGSVSLNLHSSVYLASLPSKIMSSLGGDVLQTLALGQYQTQSGLSGDSLK